MTISTNLNIFESVHKNIIDVLSISFLKILGAKNNPVRSSSDQYTQYGYGLSPLDSLLT